jgi:hypothetical protein
MAYRLEEQAEPPKWPPHLKTFNPESWCCVRRWEAARAHWWHDAGGAPFGRTQSGRARRLPFLQLMVGKGPLVCGCEGIADD